MLDGRPSLRLKLKSFLRPVRRKVESITNRALLLAGVIERGGDSLRRARFAKERRLSLAGRKEDRQKVLAGFVTLLTEGELGRAPSLAFLYHMAWLQIIIYTSNRLEGHIGASMVDQEMSHCSQMA